MAAAVYVQNELRRIEIEREQRDREFWIAAFGGGQSLQVEDGNLEDAMMKSPLAH